jgi:hypothetical protein
MRFGARAADRQPQPQTARFGRIEGVEEALPSHGRQARTQVPHRDLYGIWCGFLGAKQYFAGAPFIPLIASMALMIKLRITLGSPVWDG